jgi:putative ABC transport system permease protein
MKYVPYILKHLRKNWIRTGSTVIAMALCIFLFCTLQSVLVAVDDVLAATSANRLVTRHSVSIVFDLPLAYENRIRSVPGVKQVAINSWFGGTLPTKKEGKVEGEGGEPATTDWSNFFTNMAVEAEPYFAMYPELEMPPDQFQAFLQDQRGCVIGRKLANKFNWKVGDTFFLESFIGPYRKPDGPFEFVVRAIYDVDAQHAGVDRGMMFFHFKYLYESLGRKVMPGTYVSEIQDPEQAGVVSKAIDDLFANSEQQTRTETEKAFAASFISMAGNLALLINGIGLVVAFTILLVTANTMSMAIRERRTEIAVLKTLGFSGAQVMGLVIAEALLLGLLGGALGILGSQGLMWMLANIPGIRDMLAGMGLSSVKLQPFAAALGFVVAIGLGFAAGFVPALGAYRSKITDMLRTV